MILPFTTPGLLGGRIRPAERGTAELVLANPAGVEGVVLDERNARFIAAAFDEFSNYSKSIYGRDALPLGAGERRHLGREKPVGHRVEGEEIGERAADVNADDVSR